jgi:hypothetical protein
MAPKKYKQMSDQEITDMDRDFKKGLSPKKVHARLVSEHRQSISEHTPVPIDKEK